MKIDELSIKEKIGQRFICGVNSHNIDIIIDLIKNYFIGGVILYKKNYRSYDEMISVIKRLKEANSDNKIPLFISIDQEGGRVNRMTFELENVKNLYDLSKSDINLIFDAGDITGKMLIESGINMNFAPVLDLYVDKNRALYKRCFAGDVQDVCDGCSKYVSALSKNGVISVVKHFPGHGLTKIDSHIFAPYIYDYKEVINKHILPFEFAIDEGIDALMIGHLVVRKLTKRMPASISSDFIREYIRDRYKFEGLIITDEINMLSHNLRYKYNCFKKAFLAGSDIILVKIKDKDISFMDKIYKLVTNSEDYLEMLNESVLRIIKIKEKYAINDLVSFCGCDVNDMNKKIRNLNKKVK